MTPLLVVWTEGAKGLREMAVPQDYVRWCVCGVVLEGSNSCVLLPESHLAN
jgi:hypothetical protein